MGLRSMKRGIAKYRMKMSGVQNINDQPKFNGKKVPGVGSVFSQNWRKYLDEGTEEFQEYLKAQTINNALRKIAGWKK